jgi:DNA end-binding protein Ku
MPRSIWNGTISFGLVNVPIGLYSAIEEKQIRFHQMTKSGHRIRQKRVDEKTGKEVEYGALVKGYERSKGKVILVEPEELDAAAPEQTRTIDIEDFVDLVDIDPIYYNTTYYIAPRSGQGADKAYALLRDAMHKSGRAAIGRFVMRTKQYLVVIRAEDDVLMLETLYFADEIRNYKDLNIPSKRVSVGPKEVKIAQQLIESLTTDWDPKRYKDTFRAAVQKVIDRKAKGLTITVEEPEEEKPEVLDLVAALEASLARKGGRAGAKNTAGRRTAAAKKTTKRAAKKTRKAS